MDGMLPEWQESAPCGEKEVDAISLYTLMQIDAAVMEIQSNRI